MTLAEARVLCKPIVSTDSAGAREQLENGKGMIVECNVEALVSGIEKMIKNCELRMNYIEKLQSDLQEENSLEKIISLFGKS